MTIRDHCLDSFDTDIPLQPSLYCSEIMGKQQLEEEVKSCLGSPNLLDFDNQQTAFLPGHHSTMIPETNQSQTPYSGSGLGNQPLLSQLPPVISQNWNSVNPNNIFNDTHGVSYPEQNYTNLEQVSVNTTCIQNAGTSSRAQSLPGSSVQESVPDLGTLSELDMPGGFTMADYLKSSQDLPDTCLPTDYLKSSQDLPDTCLPTEMEFQDSSMETVPGTSADSYLLNPVPTPGRGGDTTDCMSVCSAVSEDTWQNIAGPCGYKVCIKPEPVDVQDNIPCMGQKQHPQGAYRPRGAYRKRKDAMKEEDIQNEIEKKKRKDMLKKPDDYSPTLRHKKERRKAQNRTAAEKCRIKKKNDVQLLEQEEREYIDQNKAKEDEIEKLKRVKAKLEALLTGHACYDLQAL